tara:strand:- start:1299 stop:3002 length:1704 start_codon:yes stop_codon:yes gene_type:complete
MKILENKELFASLLLLIFIYPFLLIWQGGDLTDSGYKAWHYISFFESLSKDQTNSMVFLADLFGALWLKLFPHSGFISFRVLFAIFTIALAFLTYIILKGRTKNKIILMLGIFCGIVFGIRYTTVFFSYNIASIFFLLLMGYFLIMHFELNRRIYIFTSGMMLFLAFITRFPNVVFLAFLPIILSYYHLYKSSKKNIYIKIKKIMIQYTFYCLGFFLLYGIFYGILSLNGIWDIYIENLNVLNIDKNSSYSFSNLLKRYYRDIINFYPHAIVIAFLTPIFSLLSENAKNKNNKLYFLIPLVFLFIAAIFIYGSQFSYSSNIKYFVPAFCFPPLLLSIIWKDKYSIHSFVFIIVAVTQIAGSNTGFFLKLSYGLVVLIPLTFIILYETKVVNFGNIKIFTKPICLAGISLILFLSLWSTIGTVYHVDNGLKSRTRCIFPIEHEKMKGVLTTKKRAEEIKTLTTSIKNNIKENNTLFIYGNKPIFYYLTEYEPSVNEIWLANNVLQVDELFSELEESIIQKKKYPMIVDTNENIMGSAGQKKLDAFLRKYNFYSVDINNTFTIWKTDFH